jgi:ribosomal protein S18 acetylase RimI-like enzyme
MPLAKKRSRKASGKAGVAARHDPPVVVARAAGSGLRVRPAEADDLDQVIAIDTEITGIEKVDYWYELFHRYGMRAHQNRLFLVAEDAGILQGYIIGEVRDWEFGSPPCGWVFGINVRPETREGGIGTLLLDAICTGFKRSGVTKVRTMLARDNGLIMSFFRSQGMMAAPYIALERDLD